MIYLGVGKLKGKSGPNLHVEIRQEEGDKEAQDSQALWVVQQGTEDLTFIFRLSV